MMHSQATQLLANLAPVTARTVTEDAITAALLVLENQRGSIGQRTALILASDAMRSGAPAATTLPVIEAALIINDMIACGV